MSRIKNPQDLEDAKAASLGQVLFRSARLLNDMGVERLQRDAPQVRRAHTRLLPHLDFRGIRLTELAARLEVSKQAAGQLVDELQQMGMVERVPDPSDGRARLIRFSQAGHQGLLRGLGELRALEAELAQEVGAERMARLHQDLSVLLAALEARR